MFSLFISLCLLCTQAIQFVPQNHVKQWPLSRELELFNYVAQPDPTFEYYDTGSVMNMDRKAGKWIGYQLNVTSQTWRTTDEVSISKWTHTLVVIVPDQLEILNQALIYLTGGDNVPQDIIQTDREDILLASTIATQVRSITSVMFQVPNQPIVFHTDPLQKQRHEDAVVGYTWLEFFRNTSRPELLSHVPMTKAGVRGMDVLQHFCTSKSIADLKQFVVAGASKRGWTTWLVGAVDQRVKAIIPVVMDLFHMRDTLIHHYQSLGGWSFAFSDYYDLELTRYIDTPLMSRMGQIIDVATYIPFLDMPKLAIGATGDEFFLLDDDQYWWGQLPGKNWRLIVPNAEHSLDTGIFTVINAVSGFYYAILHNLDIPEVAWKPVSENQLRVDFSTQPRLVLARHATTLTPRRDFRLVINGGNCSFIPFKTYCIQPVLWSVEILSNEKSFVYPNSKENNYPKDRYTAWLVEVSFSVPNRWDLEYVFTTQVVIEPKKLPFDPPQDGELGTLV